MAVLLPAPPKPPDTGICRTHASHYPVTLPPSLWLVGIVYHDYFY